MNQFNIMRVRRVRIKPREDDDEWTKIIIQHEDINGNEQETTIAMFDADKKPDIIVGYRVLDVQALMKK